MSEEYEAVLRVRFTAGGNQLLELDDMANELMRRMDVQSVAVHSVPVVREDYDDLTDVCAIAIQRHEELVDKLFDGVIEEIAFDLQIERDLVKGMIEWLQLRRPN